MKNKSPNSFWKTFAKNNWEKKHTLVKDFKSGIQDIDQSEIFEMLVSFSERCRKINEPSGFKLYIDGQLLHPEEVLEFLPERKDQSLVGYNTRMEEIYSDYCLVCDELLQVSQKNWKRLTEFTNLLFAHVGFPNRFVEMGLYLGNYRKTPFGVHVDGCGVFSFPIVGRKTFRLWKPKFAEAHPDLDRSLSYSKYKKDSQVIEASPGDMTYWPSSAWHVAESSGKFTATWSLGVWVDQPLRENVASALTPLLKTKLGIAGDSKSVSHDIYSQGNEIKSLPKAYQQSIERIKSISDSELRDAFMRDWVRSKSMMGFKTVPGPTKNLAPSSKSFVLEAGSIFWSKLSASKVVYAYRGNVIETPPSANLHNLVQALNDGHQCLASEFLKGTQKKRDLRTLQTLIGKNE